MTALLHGQEEADFADAGRGAEELAERCQSLNIACKRRFIAFSSPCPSLCGRQRTRWKGHWPRGESGRYLFHIVKSLFRHKKLRYRGLEKNTAQLRSLFGLANLLIIKKRLLVWL